MEAESLDAIRDIILTSYEPGDPGDSTSVKLLTTDQIKEKINNFSGFGLKNIDIYTAMVDLGFKIVNTGDKFYWRCRQK